MALVDPVDDGPLVLGSDVGCVLPLKPLTPVVGPGPLTPVTPPVPATPVTPVVPAGVDDGREPVTTFASGPVLARSEYRQGATSSPESAAAQQRQNADRSRPCEQGPRPPERSRACGAS
jgi:hypothetical protein